MYKPNETKTLKDQSKYDLYKNFDSIDFHEAKGAIDMVSFRSVEVEDRTLTVNHMCSYVSHKM